MKRAVVVGSGAGGSTAARELQGGFQVEVLDAGELFRPFTGNLALLEKARGWKARLFLHERQIEWLVPAMKIGKSGDGMVLVRGVGHGGSTTICTGNAIRQDHDLKAIGIDLDAEFEELARELPITAAHQALWHEPTRQAFAAFGDLGLQPEPTPKAVRLERCVGCGRCVLGCAYGAKWDSREYLSQAVARGAELVSSCVVQRVVVENGRATGVVATRANRTEFHPADLVVLAAGGFETAAVLRRSGIDCASGLFVDPVLCVAVRWEKAHQNREIPMPFVAQQEHFMLSPYFDFLSYFFNRHWRLPAGDIFSLMIKLADTSAGAVEPRGVRKRLQDTDRTRLNEAVGLCRDILRRMGQRDEEMFLGTLNAGHPGGTLPLTQREARTLHHEQLPENLYVADASLLPRSLGNPPILTILALARKISRACLDRAG